MSQFLIDNSLLIVVDTHNKDILESVDLYHAARYVIVIDHHRKNVNFIENAVIFHHEPYASSASEMVTEIIQYFRLDTEVSSAYADALLAGIMLDTKNFVMRTGVRTFEAAAYLRKIAIDGYIIQIDHADIKAMTAEIQKIGVNVNQIARRVNATGNAYQEDIEEIKGVLAEIWRLQRLSLLKAR